MTDEELDAIEAAAKSVVEAPLLESNGHTYTTDVIAACKTFAAIMTGNDRNYRVSVDRPTADLLIALITALRQERAAHQATRDSQTAANEVAKLWISGDRGSSDLHMWMAELCDDYDAARAQGEGAG